jgi:spore maturation protein SpmA
MALWLGFLRLAELSGLVGLLAKGLRPVLRRLFPDIPPEHPAHGAILMNMAANMLGLGNAATPLGLRAMKLLETLNPTPGIASNAMCTFLAINTSSIQLIPATAVAILSTQGSLQPTAIIGTTLLATGTAFLAGMISVRFLQTLSVFRLPPAPTPPNPNAFSSPAPDSPLLTEPPALSPKRKAMLWGFCLLLALPALFLVLPGPFQSALHSLSLPPFPLPPLPDALASQTGLPRALGVLSLFAIPCTLAFFALYAALRGVRVYEEFVIGAKDGWEVAQRIVPPLVAILVGVKMFREAGGIQILSRLLSPILSPLGVPTELLPLILVRPLSGGATTGLFTELVTQFGPDSLLARTAATIFGSTETTFYVLAVYFGSVGIRRGRHALAAGLIADATGAAASIALCRWMFS